MSERDSYAFVTLPDYLGPALTLLFIGINPGLYSVQRGHYFARKTNRFWPALSRSSLSAQVRETLGRETLGPDDDASLLDFGIGFTDVVKVPSRNASDLRPGDFQKWAPKLLAHLMAYAPRVACFHGVTAFRAFTRYGLDTPETAVELGEQPRRLDQTWLYVVPNPSPANAHFKLEDQIAWYDRLAEFLNGL